MGHATGVADGNEALDRAPAAKTDWLGALRSLGRLLANKDDTVAVFEIMRALNGRSSARGYHRLLTTVQGGRIAYEAKELAPRLMDDAWLDSLPEGSVGDAYRRFVRSEQLSAEGLATVSRQGGGLIERQHPYAWFGRRTRDVHDLWHILSGYDRDGLGEACLVAFSYAQTGGAGWALIAIGAALRLSRNEARQPYAQAIWQGYRRGRSASWLLAEDYERLMTESLDGARRRLGITPPTVYEAIPRQARVAALA